MQQRRLLALTVILLSSACAVSSARAEQTLRPEVEIDRSVLQDLKGYEPPPMFGASKSKAIAPPPLTRVPVAPPAAATLTMPKADTLLDFPVKNTEVVTRQRMTAPEETVVHARPDYSDSHTVLDMSPKTAAVKEEAPKKASAKKVAKAPLPPKKPNVQLASAKPDEAKSSVVAAAPEKAEPKKEEKVIIKAEKVPSPIAAAESAPAPMTPAAPAPKYVPKGKPTMPAVATPAPVEKNKLDAFALPLGDEIASDVVASKPTPGERIIDQALTSRLTQIDKKDIENTVAGGRVAEGRKDQPIAMAALPSDNRTSVARIEQVSMEFKSKLTELASDQKSTISTEVLPSLQKYSDSRLQIQAFAGEPTSDSDARRISLSRALSVRSYLLSKGIDPSRMDVRAMGNNTKEAPADRVDLVLIRQN